MKKHLLTSVILLTCAGIGLGLAPATSAAPAPGRHYTNFLVGLQVAVENTLETPDLTRQQSNALRQARRTLLAPSRTLSSDLLQLQNASKTLEQGFPETNAVLVEASEASLELFLDEVEAQATAVAKDLALFTNGVPESINNQWIQATNALVSAQIEENPVSQRAQDLRLALTKIQTTKKLAARSIKAPATLEGKSVLLTTGRGRNTQRTTLSSGQYNQEGEGGWSYNRTNYNTGVITVLGALVDESTDYVMTFRTTTTGNFTNSVTNGTFRVFVPRRR